ncbi:MAG TPA: hypothetical protein VFO62_03860 [Candidatus Binatia bacterium]|nr:hypothetical protein [Candidatus Binatia bacterium]
MGSNKHDKAEAAGDMLVKIWDLCERSADSEETLKEVAAMLEAMPFDHAEFVSSLPEHAGWRATWEYPGFLMWSKPGVDYIMCATPDFHEGGVIAVGVQDSQGDPVEIEGVTDVEWKRGPTRTPESYMARIIPMLGRVATYADEQAVRRAAALAKTEIPDGGSYDGSDVFDDVIKAMQNAESIGGPDGQKYIALMERIAAEATKRAANYRARFEIQLRPMCPKCTSMGTDDIEIKETYTAYHPVVEVDAVGKLAVRNALATGCPSEHFDDGKSDFVAFCRSCLHEGTPQSFGLGDPAEWEWV